MATMARSSRFPAYTRNGSADPHEPVRIALKSANLIGEGLYGVDVKQVSNRCCVIEVNDNPNVDAGNEDGVLKDALYGEVMSVFLKRIEARKQAHPR